MVDLHLLSARGEAPGRGATPTRCQQQQSLAEAGDVRARAYESADEHVSRMTADPLSRVRKTSRASAPQRSSRAFTRDRLSRSASRSRQGVPVIRETAWNSASALSISTPQLDLRALGPHLQLAEAGAGGLLFGVHLLRETLGSPSACSALVRRSSRTGLEVLNLRLQIAPRQLLTRVRRGGFGAFRALPVRPPATLLMS